MYGEKPSGSGQMTTTTTIAERWRELSGENNWEGLLDPLDNDLRQYLIHYGEMAQATYDAFNSERASKYAGSSRYAKRNLFSKVGLGSSKPLMKYQVVRYFYATSQIGVPEAFILMSFSREAWCRGSNWMGYIAVATDEGKAILGRRDIVIAWRGTIQVSEWFKDFEFPLVSASGVFGDGKDPKVHSGWLSLYTSTDPHSPFSQESAREQVVLLAAV